MYHETIFSGPQVRAAAPFQIDFVSLKVSSQASHIPNRFCLFKKFLDKNNNFSGLPRERVVQQWVSLWASPTQVPLKFWHFFPNYSLIPLAPLAGSVTFPQMILTTGPPCRLCAGGCKIVEGPISCRWDCQHILSWVSCFLHPHTCKIVEGPISCRWPTWIHCFSQHDTGNNFSHRNMTVMVKKEVPEEQVNRTWTN